MVAKSEGSKDRITYDLQDIATPLGGGGEGSVGGGHRAQRTAGARNGEELRRHSWGGVEGGVTK